MTLHDLEFEIMTDENLIFYGECDILQSLCQVVKSEILPLLVVNENEVQAFSFLSEESCGKVKW